MTNAREWKEFYSRERADLGAAGLRRLLADAPSVTLSAGGALVFPHTKLSVSGEQIAAVAKSVVDGGYETVLALGVLHGGRQEDADLVRAARAGDRAAIATLRRVHGPGVEADQGRWTEEFSLDNFHALLAAAAQMAGKPAPHCVARYPFLTGDDPDSLPGIGELRSILRDGAALVATADMVHHGAGYGTPNNLRLPREDPATLSTAMRWIAEAMSYLDRRDYSGFLAQARMVGSDFRDVGPVLAALLGRPLDAKVEALELVDYADVLKAPVPTWVAAALVRV